MKHFVKIIAVLMALAMTAGVAAAEKKAKGGKAAATKTYADRATGMQFVWAPGGCYMMGDVLNDKDALKHEQPAHEVCVDGFWMGKYEVTQKQWTAVMGGNPSEFVGENRPVENVSWDDAQRFMSKLNAKSGKRYRLPTEAEWEYAARSGGKNEKWAGTSNEKELKNYAWYQRNFKEGTHPVGQLLPNGLGLYDMTGNVWEWCGDWYGASAYADDALKGKSRNPQGPSTGADRVARGGSWYSSARDARASYRNYGTPGNPYGILGLRLLLPPVQ